MFMKYNQTGITTIIYLYKDINRNIKQIIFFRSSNRSNRLQIYNILKALQYIRLCNILESKIGLSVKLRARENQRTCQKIV